MIKRTLYIGLTASILFNPFINVSAEEREVVFATEAAFPPFNERAADGSIVGMEVELAMAMCEKVNLKCRFVAQNWDGMIPGLLFKKFDGIFASMSITEQRKKKIDFTNKYYSTQSTFFTHKGENLDISSKTIEGKTIGTIAGVTECYLKKEYPDADIKVYDNSESMFLDIKSKRLDAGFSEYIALDYGLLREEGGSAFEVVGEPVLDEDCFGVGIGIGIRKEDKELKQVLNNAIDLVREDGTYQRIASKYFSYDIYGE